MHFQKVEGAEDHVLDDFQTGYLRIWLVGRNSQQERHLILASRGKRVRSLEQIEVSLIPGWMMENGLIGTAGKHKMEQNLSPRASEEGATEM